MDSFNLNENVCRICLDHKIILNWNEEIFEFCGTSYKDCYYKYTQLEESDSDCYPTNLCEICADELKNAHFLFEKAFESHNILEVTFTAKELETNYCDMEICNRQYKMQRNENKTTIKLPETIDSTDDNILIEQLSNVCDNESIAESENTIDNLNGMSMSADIIIEPSHFIDIKNFESTDESLLEQSSSPSKNYRKRSRLKSVHSTLNEKLNEISETKLPESANTKNSENKEKNCERPSQSLLEPSHNENCDSNSPKPSTTSHAFKTRKKYILICQYCSLKVNGTNQLKIHEATHSENRKRTETCPHCGVKLYTKMALNQHINIHKENRQKNHKCEFCEKAFFNKGALNVHRRIHLGQMVKCQLCPKEFFRQIDLDKHLLRHSVSPLQKNVGKKKYVVECQYCNKSVFTDKWKEHVAAHLDQPQMKCKICDKKFFSRSSCTKHLRQVHHKNSSEYEEFIHYFVDRNSRITNLRMQQQLGVQQFTE